MNIFEQATRRKLRFQTVRGPVGVEELWELPLRSKAGCDLDNVAKAVNRDCKALEEESFVATKTAEGTEHALKLEIVKHIIAEKLAVEDAMNNLARQSAERQKLLGILQEKEDKALMDLSPDELKARIASLSGGK